MLMQNKLILPDGVALVKGGVPTYMKNKTVAAANKSASSPL